MQTSQAIVRPPIKMADKNRPGAEDDATRPASLLQRRFGLTARESQLLYWLTRGKSNREMGIILGISARTVDKHLQHVFEKMDVGSRHAAVVQAIEVLRPTGNPVRGTAYRHSVAFPIHLHP
jgi:DNA-binding CsgD family transcriptional regulator